MQRGWGMMDASEGRRRSSLASPTRPTERAGLCFAAAHWDDQQGQARPAGMPRRRDFQVSSSQVCPALRLKDAHAQPCAAVTGIRARSRTVAGGPGVGMSERRSRSLEARNDSGVRAVRRARATMLRETSRREPVHQVCPGSGWSWWQLQATMPAAVALSMVREDGTCGRHDLCHYAAPYRHARACAPPLSRGVATHPQRLGSWEYGWWRAHHQFQFDL